MLIEGRRQGFSDLGRLAVFDLMAVHHEYRPALPEKGDRGEEGGKSWR